MSELEAMPTRTADTSRWKAATVALALLVLPTTAATAGEHAAGAALCAEREALLQTLVEAHGQIPNAASALLAESSIAIAQARADCDDGRGEAALAIYDRLIAKLASPDEREPASVTGSAR
jgi:hypothetical protein